MNLKDTEAGNDEEMSIGKYCFNMGVLLVLQM